MSLVNENSNRSKGNDKAEEEETKMEEQGQDEKMIRKELLNKMEQQCEDEKMI